MSKIYSSLLFVLFFFAANAQNNIVIKGTVYDINTQKPLESAMVYFSNVKDSTVVEYAATDKNGDFKISTKKYDKPVFLKINFVGYQTYTEEQNKLLENKDFGKLYLSQSENALKEVVIKSEAPPIKIKKDTLEFNASSYKVRPDANVETLLKQLPGVEVDSDGKVTANGKEVTQFLVNGKSFFGKDGAILLKNMPAEVINKVQVSDFKTKKEELSKQESSSDDASINFTIDEKKNKGLFGKIMGGYGTDDRYESSFILNYFNNKQKISLLASANNINSTGFSMDEVFDNMGGGRNTRQSSRPTGTGKGITTSNLVGFNYSDEWVKDFNATAGYNFSNTINKNETKSSQASFLPTGTIFTEADSKARNENTGNKANFEFEYKINPTTRLVVTPVIDQSRTNSSSESSSFSKDENGASLNESNASSYKENSSANFTNTINFNKAFERKARNLSFVFSNANSNSESDALNQSKTVFYQGGRPDDERNQNGKSNNTADSYTAEIEYTEPITDSLRIRIGSELGWANEVNDAKTYEYDVFSESFSILNVAQSNYITSRQNSITPKAGLTFEKSNFTFNFNSRTSIVDYDNHSLYLNKATDLNQQYVLPYGNMQIRYRFDKSKFITFRYDYSSSLPTATQLMPVLNLANPLNTIIGNPYLNLNKKNSVNINYRNFDVRTRSGYSFFARGDFFDSQVVSNSIYDDSGKRTTTYSNVSGTYTTSIGGNWNQTIKNDANVYRYGLGLNGSYSLDKGYTDAVLYNSKSLGLSPRVYVSYEYGELLTVSPSYSFSYNESKYNNSSIDATSNVVHRLNIQTTNYWPKNWIWGNDFGYTYNSNISDDFKKDFYLWNTSLSYGFFEKKMTLKVKVYDVLNQNQSATRTISPTTIRDEENTVLKRYAMFSLTYKIGSFGGPKERRGPGGGGGRGEGMF
ncbi:outer membrane beta-barrel protein [Flavobacterium aquicola]|uniref:Carboxypeptidase-like protein n=1 Tax=Flavobacterium aquicola TaxID=1682742 RepID=A0A3E0EKF6_9FLAO|nr:outer membrane beta-barrel protein [Flavobacterium aquicola]REG98661.1 carboxypeptidase-like protein [Flavobacterium aquicola]